MEPMIPWYKSAIVRQQIIAIVTGILGILGVATDIDWDATITGILAAVGLAVPVWTLITRIVKPSPPITVKAATKLEEIKARSPSNQKGFVRAGMLELIMAIMMAAAVIGGVVATLPGCSVMGVPAAEKFNSKAASGLALVTSIRESALALGQAGAITLEDAKSLQEQANSGREAINIARTLRNVNLAQAEQRLDATIAVLKALQLYVKQQGGGGS